MFHFSPDLLTGSVNVTVDPPVADFPVAMPKLTQVACGDWQNKLHASIGADGAVFGGAYSAACGEKTWYLHPVNL